MVHKYKEHNLQCAIALAAFAMTTCVAPIGSRAADAGGNYYIGGGVGGLKCPEFLNAMRETRQFGGVHSITGGANRISVWEEYLLGFETGYNLGSPGVLDVFASLGGSDVERLDNALYWIESWCEKHPDQLFGSAAVALAQTLHPPH